MNKTSTLAKTSVELADEDAMVSFGWAISSSLIKNNALIKKPVVITLQGQLGAGKTTLSRGLLQGLGHRGSVKSPTYTLVEPYQLPVGSVFHFDLYRIVDAEELEYMGFAEYLAEAKLCLIEWPEPGQGFLPQADIAVEISQSGEGRCVTLAAYSVCGEQLLDQLDWDQD
jgi:tRNA threonylcarbamoyladenosine biosynthesis protein TsaE